MILDKGTEADAARPAKYLTWRGSEIFRICWFLPDIDRQFKQGHRTAHFYTFLQVPIPVVSSIDDLPIITEEEVLLDAPQQIPERESKDTLPLRALEVMVRSIWMRTWTFTSTISKNQTSTKEASWLPCLPGYWWQEKQGFSDFQEMLEVTHRPEERTLLLTFSDYVNKILVNRFFMPNCS